MAKRRILLDGNTIRPLEGEISEGKDASFDQNKLEPKPTVFPTEITANRAECFPQNNFSAA